ncbi:MAG: hypothetical protein DA407_06205 [Bacteroidetes bacterium]|nr:MAG: hypothetical protein DA407_06205 [Bacteroidota bacterium]
MLNFFRKIRFNLMVTNKTSKYLKYAIGEILLVMVGILLALQVNNWNESNARKTKLKINLENFIENLTMDIATMNRLESVSTFRYYSMQYLLEISGETPFRAEDEELKPNPYIKFRDFIELPTEYDSTFIQAAFLYSQRIVDQTLNLYAIEEMKNIGTFSQLTNYNLKENINKYYKRWEKAIGPTNYSKHLEIVENWEKSLGKEGVLTSETNQLKNPLDLIKNNKERAYLLKRLIREAAWMIEISQELKIKANDLTTEIKEEIKTL